MHMYTVSTPETKIIYICLPQASLVFKKESRTPGSKSLIISQATYRIIKVIGKKFKKELNKYLTAHLFYSITEFLECKTNKRNV